MKRRDSDAGTIIFDCDDVLLDWQEGFRNWMGALNGIHLDPAGPSSWDMNSWVGRSAMPFVERFNASITFGSLLPCPGAKEAVRRLYAAGNNLHVVTACSDDPTTVARRERNLDRVFGDVFTSIICVPIGQSKADALREIVDANPATVPIWVEDNVRHATTGHGLGLNAFVMRRNHNRHLETCTIATVRPMTWIDTFSELLDHLTPELLAA